MDLTDDFKAAAQAQLGWFELQMVPLRRSADEARTLATEREAQVFALRRQMNDLRRLLGEAVEDDAQQEVCGEELAAVAANALRAIGSPCGLETIYDEIVGRGIRPHGAGGGRDNLRTQLLRHPNVVKSGRGVYAYKEVA